MNLTIARRGLSYFKYAQKKLSTASVPGIAQAEFADRRLNFAKKITSFEAEEPRSSSHHLVLIPANEIQYQSLHVPYHPFRQDSYFRYLTGILEPGALLALEISSSTDSFDFVPRLFVEERNAHDSLWDGPTPGVKGNAETTGIRDTLSIDLLPEYLSSALSLLKDSKTGFIWYSPPFTLHRQVKTAINMTTLNLVLQKFADCAITDEQIQDPSPVLDSLRVIKSPAEIALLRSSAEVTAAALKKTMQSAFPGIREAALAARMHFEVQMMGAKLGYPAVVAGGSRANIIHYLANEGVVEDDQLVLMDVGAEIDGYTADISRAWPVNGRFTKEQLILHEVLVQVQHDCQQAAGPESNLEALYNLMLKRLSKYLVEEHVLRESELSGHAHLICPHHVGHHLGLDVHDAPSISYNHPLVFGSVFPLEPGIYFPEAGSDQFRIPPEFRGLGLRLEDDFVINQEGQAEKLTTSLPSDASELEAWINIPYSPCSDHERTNY